MTIAKILVPVRGDGKGEGVLEHAIAIATVFNAHIETVYCRTKSEDLIPYGVVVPRFLKSQIEQSISSVAEGEEKHMHALFDRFMEKFSLASVPLGEVPPRDRVSVTWREEQGKQADILGLRGRLADLVVVAQPDPEANLGVNTLHAALMNTGRPVLMCPPGHPSGHPLDHLVIAWNGSTEASRAVALGLDLIGAAGRVSILTVGRQPSKAGAAELAEYLAVRGIATEHHPVSDDGDVGQSILAGSEALGADLLLMGAYSHSRGREALFGGASQHIVNHARLPVVMVH